MADLEELLGVARRAALAGAQVALDWRSRASRLRVEEKAGPADLVSQADRDAEEAIRAVLAECRPDDGVLGEESGTAPGRSGVHWLVDPIDGTTSYLYDREDWSVSVAACATSGRRLLAGVVAEPVLHRITEACDGGGTRTDQAPAGVRREQDLSRALVEVNLGRPDQRPRAADMVAVLTPRVRDLRRGGSAAAALARVAGGRADAAWLPGLQPWDFAAGVLLVREAGGVVGDLDGRSDGTWPRSGDILAAPEELFEPLRDLLSAAYRTTT
ncbi:inositol monophosphatase family protein [Paractinoplanes maris]|uniref:inositol monophosphatase family protein n=1 Tax=Paractinoplanes maris TaxID=1734446 RepID=UPI002021B8B8|nr:inositol monophosphatase family protein [Actinoplanes maris]